MTGVKRVNDITGKLTVVSVLSTIILLIFSDTFVGKLLYHHCKEPIPEMREIYPTF